MSDILQFLKFLHSGQPFEIRVLGIPGKEGAKWTKYGYYDDPVKATADIAEIAKLGPSGIYTTVNSVSPDVLARSYNKLSSGKTASTDSDVPRRKWLFVDIDAGQPSGVCSTEDERKQSVALMRRLVEVMREQGWRESLKGNSGNGCYLLYEIDLPNDEQSGLLAARVLDRMAEAGKGDFGRAHIDTTVHNAARLMRVLGTWNRKGDSVGERVHRQSKYELQIGEPVSREQMEAFAPAKSIASKVLTEFSVIDDEAVEQEAREECYRQEADWSGDGSKYVLSLCRIVKGKGLPEYSAVRIVKEVIADHPDFPKAYTDDQIVARFRDAKVTPGETLKPPAELRNYDIDEKKLIPRDLGQILADFRRLRLDLVVCRGELYLISEGAEGKEFRPIQRTDQLFAVILGVTKVAWNNGITKSEFFEAVKCSVPRVDSIELTPHFPPLPGIRYLNEIPEGPTTELEKLLDLLNPHTAFDRDLLRAAICTMSWGGPAGKRPGFAIISAEETQAEQIGSGKSSTCNLCIMPYGLGRVLQHTVRASRDFEQLVKHMVGPSGAGIRAIVLDNIKGSISGQDIESLMTTVTVTGHQMYSGYGATPNYFTWFANGNGLRMSDDVAKRLMPVMIDKAEYDSTWDARVKAINWTAVLSGVRVILDRPAKQLPVYSRWSLWESEVLSKCCNYPDALLVELARRQRGLSETEEAIKELTEAIDSWIDENQDFLSEKYQDCHVLSGSDLAQILRSVSHNGANWNPRSVARRLRELRFLDGLICRHPDTSTKRYVWRLQADTSSGKR